MLDLLPEILPNILGIIPNLGKWSEMVPDIMSRSIKFENIFIYKSIRMAIYSGWL